MHVRQPHHRRAVWRYSLCIRTKISSPSPGCAVGRPRPTLRVPERKGREASPSLRQPSAVSDLAMCRVTWHRSAACRLSPDSLFLTASQLEAKRASQLCQRGGGKTASFFACVENVTVCLEVSVQMRPHRTLALLLRRGRNRLCPPRGEKLASGK